MADTIGRGEPRTVPSLVTTNTSTAITAPAGSFSAADVGAPISGTGIPAGATIAAVASGTAATLSAAATASGTVTATVGLQLASSAGFTGWVPESQARANDYTMPSQAAGVAPLDKLVDPDTRDGQASEH